MKKNIFIVSFFLSFTLSLFSQQKDSLCVVLLKEISGSYKGGCKNRLANEKGIATGEDTYAGMFKNGLPDGKGKYTYKNKNTYSGSWKKGLKDGKGKFKYFINGKVTILQGYWKEGNYVGLSKVKEDYRVTNITSIENYSIKKVNGSQNIIGISFKRAMRNYIPRDLEILISSGHLIKQNKKILIADNIYPINCAISFTIKTAGGYRQCKFTFDILKSGKYEVFISNN